MIRIDIVNDGTANIPENIAHPPGRDPFYILGNYKYKIYANATLLHEGRLEDHLVLSGWEGLISLLDKDVNGERFR